MKAFLTTAVVALALFGGFGEPSSAKAQQLDPATRDRPLIRVPIVKPAPDWDYNLVPRYRYRAEDDRVDPCGGPVIPVVRFGAQETTVPVEVANSLGLGLIHGRDWPCNRQRR